MEYVYRQQQTITQAYNKKLNDDSSYERRASNKRVVREGGT